MCFGKISGSIKGCMTVCLCVVFVNADGQSTEPLWSTASLCSHRKECTHWD